MSKRPYCELIWTIIYSGKIYYYGPRDRQRTPRGVQDCTSWNTHPVLRHISPMSRGTTTGYLLCPQLGFFLPKISVSCEFSFTIHDWMNKIPPSQTSIKFEISEFPCSELRVVHLRIPTFLLPFSLIIDTSRTIQTQFVKIRVIEDF